MAKKAVFGQNRLKWPFLAIFPEKCPVATGLKTGENPIFGVFSQKRLEIPAPGDPAGAAFTSTPRGGAPWPDFGDSEACRGRRCKKGFPEPQRAPQTRRAPAWLSGPRDGDRAPPRGVDVKPPSRGWLSRDPGSRRSRKPSPEPGEPSLARETGIPDPGIWSQDPSGAPGHPGTPRSRAPAPRRPARQGLFYINPSRRGPVPGRASSSDATSRRVTPGRRGPWAWGICCGR